MQEFGVTVDQDEKFYLIRLRILITCLLCNVWMLLGEVACWSLLGVSGLRCNDDNDGNDATLFENKFQKTFGCQINGLQEIHHT